MADVDVAVVVVVDVAEADPALAFAVVWDDDADIEGADVDGVEHALLCS